MVCGPSDFSLPALLHSGQPPKRRQHWAGQILRDGPGPSVWEALRPSWRMRTMLHTFPDSIAYDQKLLTPRRNLCH